MKLKRYRSKGRSTHTRNRIFAQIVYSIDCVVLEVRKVLDEEFDVCGGNDLQRRIRRVGEIYEAFEGISSLFGRNSA